MRAFPAEIYKDDTVALKYPAKPDGFASVTSGKVKHLLGETEVETALTIGEENLTATLTIAEAASGTLRFQVQVTGEDADGAAVTRTIEAGEAAYINPTQTAPTADEMLLASLRRIYQARVDGNKSIVSYTVGGRQVNLMPLPELDALINKVEQRIAAKRRFRRGGTRSHVIWRA